MERENNKKWINAAILLIENPANKVLCPKCKNAFLDVKDVFLDEKKPELGIERYLLCSNCDCHEVILLKKKNITFGVVQNNNIWFHKIE